MKATLLSCIAFSLLLFFSTPARGQLIKSLGEKAKAKIGQRTNTKVDQAMDKGLDKAEEPVKVKTDPDGSVKIKDEEGNKIKTEGGKPQDNNKAERLSYSSKYDFVPGEKLVAIEDFSSTSIGDFPARWNTNATAEVVSLNNKEGKWLKINKEGVWLPEFIDKLPENFTMEFDLGVNNDFDASPFVVNIANLADKEKDYTDFYHQVRWMHGHALHLALKPYNGLSSGYLRILAGKDGNHMLNNTIDFKNWDNNTTNFAHVAIWRQAQRLRVYVNGEKLLDAPRAFEAGGKYNTVTMAMQGSYRPDDYYLLGNLRLAVGASDARNKLTEGKFVTRGILFDVNSDQLNPVSFGALKEIGNLLKENPAVKYKIVGHTDADGDEKANLDLSKRRAAAVKAYLVQEFGLQADNFLTDGKGEAEPVEKNNSAEGKANNRRVEFIKI